MYTTVLERTREIGILKALGAAPADIMGMLARETVLLAVGGWIAGILLSFAPTSRSTTSSAPACNRSLRRTGGRAFSRHRLVAPCWAHLSRPAAARQDAIEALSYE